MINSKYPPELVAKSVQSMLEQYVRARSCSRIWCFTDRGRRWLAEAILEQGSKMGLAPVLIELPAERYSPQDLGHFEHLLRSLTERDLVFSVFSGDSGVPYHTLLPNLKSPEGFKGVSAVIRQRYQDRALLTHLQTDIETVDELVERYLELNAIRKVRITAPGGTDLVCELMRGVVLPYKVSGSNRHAFLPPSEVTFGIVPGSAQGVIVVDVTVGEFGTPGDGLVDPLGLVDKPVVLRVEKGYVVEVEGGQIAQRLQHCFDRYDKKCRLVVELGFGLSRGEPTGQIGPDECLQGTFHFGIGNDFFYGRTNDADVHLDVVSRAPKIDILEWR